MHAGNSVRLDEFQEWALPACFRLTSTDDDGPGWDTEFSLDQDYPIWETDEAAALLDVTHGPRNRRFLSKEGLTGLPARLVLIDDFVPMAFVRELESLIEGGDLLAVSTAVRLVHFENTSDATTVRLDDIGDILSTSNVSKKAG
jgi:hypothetical protein